MDIYHVWCDLEDGVGDLDFARRIDAYLGGLWRRGKSSALVRNARFALYRDFPDEFREEGDERF